MKLFYGPPFEYILRLFYLTSARSSGANLALGIDGDLSSGDGLEIPSRFVGFRNGGRNYMINKAAGSHNSLDAR